MGWQLYESVGIAFGENVGELLVLQAFQVFEAVDARGHAFVFDLRQPSPSGLLPPPRDAWGDLRGHAWGNIRGNTQGRWV